MSPTDARVRAAELGIPFPIAEEHYQREREVVAARVEEGKTLRARIFKHYGGGIAFHRRFPATGDHSRIPGFDVWAQSAAADFPGIIGTTDPAADLWAFLKTPAERMPSAEELWERAFRSASLEAGAQEIAAADDFVSLADGAALADVSPYWLRCLIRDGRIPGRKIGAAWIVSRTAAAAFKRHPSRGRPRRSRDCADVPF